MKRYRHAARHLAECASLARNVGDFGNFVTHDRYNADLANGIGNLASRTLTMIHQYFGGTVPASAGDELIAQKAQEAGQAMEDHFEQFDFTRGIEAVLAFVSQIDKFIVERAPWKLAKDRNANLETEAKLASMRAALTI